MRPRASPNTRAPLLLEHLIELDMDALAERMMMTLAGGEERTRFLGSLGLDPPLLHPRLQHGGVEEFRLRSRFEFADG